MTDEKLIVQLINRMVSAVNEGKKRFGSTASFIDPALFSKAIRNTNLTEDAFRTLVQYMNENGIPVVNEFLLNAFQSLLCDEKNINSLLDIIDFFSETDPNGLTSVSGEYWRCFMNCLSHNKEATQDEYDNIRRYALSNRNSLLYTLFRYFRKEKISFYYLYYRVFFTMYYTELLGSINECNKMRFQNEIEWISKEPSILFQKLE